MPIMMMYCVHLVMKEISAIHQVWPTFKGPYEIELKYAMANTYEIENIQWLVIP